VIEPIVHDSEHTYPSTVLGVETVTLIRQLVAALELREASDPDSPAWGAEREIRKLEHRILASTRDSA
jgi:hypothetical protein